MLDSVLSLVKLIRYRKVYIDERIFRLHCLFTSIILLICFLIISTKQIAGEPIDCDTNHESVKPSVLNTYCLIHYTYTVSDGFFQRLQEDVVAPGVRFGPTEEEIHYNYYQWIWFLFFMEALFFYIPRWLWKGWESGTIAHLVSGFNEFMPEEKKMIKKSLIIDYLLKSSPNQSYGRRYLFCLFLAFCNVILQMSFMHFIFNGEFYTYGLKVFLFIYEDPDLRRDALIKVFPRVTKCRFSKFGTSGVIQHLDALCVLPLNMYNEIIFVFLWFWFAFLALLLFLSIITKIILMLSPFARLYYINKEFRLGHFWKKDDSDYQTVRSLQFGETFVLILIKENTGVMFCNELVRELIKIKKKQGGAQTNLNDSTIMQHQEILSSRQGQEQDNKLDDSQEEQELDNSDERSSLIDDKDTNQTTIDMTETKVGSQST